MSSLSFVAPRTTTPGNRRTPNSVIRPITLRPFTPEASSPQRSFPEYALRSPIQEMSSPGISIPTPRITSPPTIPRSYVYSTPRIINQPPSSVTPLTVATNRIPSSMLRSHHNPVSPTPEEPIIINGRPFDPSFLTPIIRHSNTYAQQSLPTNPMQEVTVNSVVPPPVIKKVKRTKKKQVQQTWDQIVKNYQVPDYNLMSPEQCRSIRNDFLIKFNLMKNYCPTMGIVNLAENEALSLTEIHVGYSKIFDQISTRSNADWYKMIMVLCWLGTEWFITKYLGLKSGGYAYFQSRNMSKYNYLLSQLGEVDRSKGFASWSPMAQLVAGSCINLVIFVIVQTFLENSMDTDKRNQLCNMVGSFFTSTDTAGPPGLAGVPGLLAAGDPRENPEGVAGVASGLLNDNGMMGMLGGLMGMFGGGNRQAQPQQQPTAQTQPTAPAGRRRPIED